MQSIEKVLILILDGTSMKRQQFLNYIRNSIIIFTRNAMLIDVLINEISKNIYDHADRKGEIIITQIGGKYFFIVRDYGCNEYTFSNCIGHSTKKGNGVNCNMGLGMILEYAESFKIILCIDTSKGFCYSGFYDPNRIRGSKRLPDRELLEFLFK
jgi:anti-sigma regulatory factor (Ser/Thr protein kinase)